MYSRLILTLLCVCSSGCLDDTDSLSDGNVPPPAPTTTPQEQQQPAAGQGGASGTTEPGSAAGAGDGGTTQSGGAGGQENPEPICEPVGEVCNGLDDDCDGELDEGCPASLAWRTAQSRAALGDSTGGSEFTDSCAKDEILVGLHVATVAWVDQVTGICRKFTLHVDTAKTPYEYSLEFGTTRELAAHPEETTGEVKSLLCEEDQALVGLRISQQNYVQSEEMTHVVVPSIWAYCAEPALAVIGDEASVVWQDPVKIGPVSGYGADSTAWFVEDQLVSPKLAVTLHGMSGAWIDRIGLGTSEIDVSFR